MSKNTRDHLFRKAVANFVAGFTGNEEYPYVLTREEPCRGNTHVYLITSPCYLTCEWIEYFSDYFDIFSDNTMSVSLSNADPVMMTGTVKVKYDSRKNTYPFGDHLGEIVAHSQAASKMMQRRIRYATDESVQRFKIARKNGVEVFQSAYEKLATKDLAICSVCLESISPKHLNVPICYHLICSACQPRCQGKCPECRMKYA